ncbi:MAG TPA: GC-type dockerin domain-anchored protein [Phycisphaerales bacterium]|nr:GC-type dockerin domain-anchored protein [Phycisphaerales bacterium]
MGARGEGRRCPPARVVAACLGLACVGSAADGQSVARQWNEALLEAIRIDTPRPTVHARNLFHVSVAMYDAWALYDDTATPYLVRERLSADDPDAARREAISFAAYRVLRARFANSPGKDESYAAFDAIMDGLGYDKLYENTVGGDPAAVGNRCAAMVIAYGLSDGANEAGNYADTTGYFPVNPPLDPTERGTSMLDPNRWQPLEINGGVQKFLTPQWNWVTPFALVRGQLGAPYHDMGAPPLLGGAGDADFKEGLIDFIMLSGELDPDSGVAIDASPGSIGNNSLGSDDGAGWDLNPYTGLPYAPNPVKLGDYGRVLAEFWADGPRSETPPGHWNAIANDASDDPRLEKRIGGAGEIVGDLEWDVKLYFALNGAVHDAAVVSWGMKEGYDSARPISMVRYCAGLGQSSDEGLPSYHPDGLPLVDGLIELITEQTTQDGERHEHLAGHEGEIAIVAWAGHPADPDNQYAGAAWILAEDWWPYQARGFVTPGFAGYSSGHSTFSRAAAEVLTAFTGEEFFPGGIGGYAVAQGQYGSIEYGPSEPVEIQWATYRDAADQAGISRRWGGIHVMADDYNGRISGAACGAEAWALALRYFGGEPPCPGDWDDDGNRNIIDIIAFLNAYTGGSGRADLTNDGVLNTLDVLAFLDAWASGC